MSGGFSTSGSSPNGPTTYAAILAKIHNPRRRKKGDCKIAHNTWARLQPEGMVRVGGIEIDLYDTTILTLYPDGEAICGTSYHSLLTRGRLNAYLPSGWRVFSDRDVTYVGGPNGFLVRMQAGVVVGWDTGEVREHLRALRLCPNVTKEAKHARAELALFYTRRGWTRMAEIMMSSLRPDMRVDDYTFTQIPRRVRTPLYLRQTWHNYGGKPLWLADDDGALIRPVTGADVSFDRVETYTPNDTEPYAWIDGVKYRLVDPVETFDKSQDVRHARRRAQLEAAE